MTAISVFTTKEGVGFSDARSFAVFKRDAGAVDACVWVRLGRRGGKGKKCEMRVKIDTFNWCFDMCVAITQKIHIKNDMRKIK